MQFELAGQSQVTSALDLGINVNGGARNIVAIRGVVEPPNTTSFLALHDESSAGGAGGGGSTFFVDLNNCQPRAFGERFETFLAGVVQYYACEAVPGGTRVSWVSGSINNAGTGMDHDIESFAHDPAAGSLVSLGVTSIQHPAGPPDECF